MVQLNGKVPQHFSCDRKAPQIPAFERLIFINPYKLAIRKAGMPLQTQVPKVLYPCGLCGFSVASRNNLTKELL